MQPDELAKICEVMGSPHGEVWPEGQRLAAAMGFSFPDAQPEVLAQCPFTCFDRGSACALLCSCKAVKLMAIVFYCRQHACCRLRQMVACSQGTSMQTSRSIAAERCNSAGLQAFSSVVPGASGAACELMTALCSWDPERRPTAAQALQHPFFQVTMQGLQHACPAYKKPAEPLLPGDARCRACSSA